MVKLNLTITYLWVKYVELKYVWNEKKQQKLKQKYSFNQIYNFV